MYIYVYMYICIYGYMYICKYVYMYIWIYGYMDICIYVYMYICIYVFMYICIYVYMYDVHMNIRMYKHKLSACVYIRTSIHLCIWKNSHIHPCTTDHAHVHMCTCRSCAYNLCIYTHTHTDYCNRSPISHYDDPTLDSPNTPLPPNPKAKPIPKDSKLIRIAGPS